MTKTEILNPEEWAAQVDPDKLMNWYQMASGYADYCMIWQKKDILKAIKECEPFAHEDNRVVGSVMSIGYNLGVSKYQDNLRKMGIEI